MFEDAEVTMTICTSWATPSSTLAGLEFEDIPKETEKIGITRVEAMKATFGSPPVKCSVRTSIGSVVVRMVEELEELLRVTARADKCSMGCHIILGIRTWWPGNLVGHGLAGVWENSG